MISGRKCSFWILEPNLQQGCKHSPFTFAFHILISHRNLINANHIIFVSPLLAKTQHEYDSAMAQAIARSRRYGQDKKVHIYHVVAQRTIDVDILEHRHKRTDGICTAMSTMIMPKASGKKKERTKLIKNTAGEMALVPSSWLTDKAKQRMLNIGQKPDSFTSLINFSEMVDHESD